MHLAFSDHTGALGTVLFFRKGAGACSIQRYSSNTSKSHDFK
jgi:hypothetical protein